jgi:hypothetical protein
MDSSGDIFIRCLTRPHFQYYGEDLAEYRFVPGIQFLSQTKRYKNVKSPPFSGALEQLLFYLQIKPTTRLSTLTESGLTKNGAWAKTPGWKFTRTRSTNLCSIAMPSQNYAALNI